MAKKEILFLSRRERQIIDIIYMLGEATATQVLENLEEPVGEASIRKLIRVIEKKGYLTHRRVGHSYIYSPTVPKKAASNQALLRCGGKPFDGEQTHADGMVPAGPGNLAEVDVRRQNGQTHTPGFGDIGEGAVKAALVADDRGHEFGRMVEFEVGRLEGNPRVGCTVGFAKGIAAETHHHVPNGGNLLFGDVASAGAGIKSFSIILQLIIDESGQSRPNMPPPRPAEFRMMSQLKTVRLLASLRYIAPPSSSASFCSNIESEIVPEQTGSKYIAPP